MCNKTDKSLINKYIIIRKSNFCKEKSETGLTFQKQVSYKFCINF